MPTPQKLLPYKQFKIQPFESPSAPFEWMSSISPPPTIKPRSRPLVLISLSVALSFCFVHSSSVTPPMTCLWSLWLLCHPCHSPVQIPSLRSPPSDKRHCARHFLPLLHVFLYAGTVSRAITSLGQSDMSTPPQEMDSSETSLSLPYCRSLSQLRLCFYSSLKDYRHRVILSDSAAYTECLLLSLGTASLRLSYISHHNFSVVNLWERLGWDGPSYRHSPILCCSPSHPWNPLPPPPSLPEPAAPFPGS